MLTIRDLIIIELSKTVKTGQNQIKESDLSNLQSEFKQFRSEYLVARDGLVAEGVITRSHDLNDNILTIVDINRANQKLIVPKSDTDLVFEKLILDGTISLDQEIPQFPASKIKFLIKELEARGLTVEYELNTNTINNKTLKSGFFDDFERSFVFTSHEEEIAVNLIIALFNYDEILQITGEWGKLVRQITRLESGKDRKGSKFELASSLVLKYGIDLFKENKHLVSAIAKKIGITDYPKIWKVGSPSVRQFLALAGFPETFAGEPRREAEKSLFFQKRFDLPKLTDFQLRAYDLVSDILRNSGSKVILRMPTGTGKTRTGIECINTWFVGNFANKKKKLIAIWVAHTEELCEQAIYQFSSIYNSTIFRDYPVELFRLFGEYLNKNEELDEEQTGRLADSAQGAYVIVTNNIVLSRLIENRERIGWFSNLLKSSEILLIIDEAHRSCAETIKNSVSELYKEKNTMNLFGLTATPKRSTGTDNEKQDTNRLHQMFDNHIIDPFSDKSNPKRFLVENRILAKPTFSEINTGFTVGVGDISEFENEDKIEQTDLQRIIGIEKELAEKVDNWIRRKPVIEKIAAIVKQQPNSKLIYFGANNSDSEIVNWGLRRYGIRSESLTSATTSYRRRTTVDNFKTSELQVLCNCLILTTGYDNPQITHVVIGRPTISTVLFEQMIGRGLRGSLFGGTDKCDIIYVRDKFNPYNNIKFAYDVIKNIWDLDFQKSSMNENIFDSIKRSKASNPMDNYQNSNLKNMNDYLTKKPSLPGNKQKKELPNNNELITKIYRSLQKDAVQRLDLHSEKLESLLGISKSEANSVYFILRNSTGLKIRDFGDGFYIPWHSDVPTLITRNKNAIINSISCLIQLNKAA